MNNLDLTIPRLAQGYQNGQWTVMEVVDKIHQRMDRRGQDSVWIHLLTRSQVQQYVLQAERWKKRGKILPLFGVPFAIKDNIDLAEHPTTAACPAFSYIPPVSATVVEKLIAAGAIPIGKTNLDQFATGLVGVRSPYGAPRSVFDSRYISGGSSSGSAVAVAAGLVSFSLGTDTAGSGRVPAAFNNIIGLKPTKGRLSIKGVVPACRSLDCVSIFAADVEDSLTVLKVAEGPDELDPWSRETENIRWKNPESGFRFGVPQPKLLEFFSDEGAADLFEVAVKKLTQLGGKAVTIDYQPFLDTARLLYAGPWVAERLAAIQSFYQQQPESIHPVVRQIIRGAEKMTAVDAFQGFYRLQELRARVQQIWETIDLLVLPTTGTTYTVEQIEADPVTLNSNLGYYTNFVNLLDLCGLAVPAGFRENGLPFGVTFLAPAFSDLAIGKLGQKFLKNYEDN